MEDVFGGPFLVSLSDYSIIYYTKLLPRFLSGCLTPRRKKVVKVTQRRRVMDVNFRAKYIDICSLSDTT